MSRVLLGGLLLVLLTVEAHAAAPPPVRRDRYGDPLPVGALSRLGTIRLRPKSPFLKAALSPDGRWLVWSEGKSLLFHALRGEPAVRRLTLTDHDAIGQIQFTPDSRFVVVLGWDGQPPARVFDAGTLRLLHRVMPSIPGMHFEIAAGGALLLGSRGWFSLTPDPDDCFVWDLVNGRQLHRIKGAFTISCSPDGKTLATGHPGGAVRLWRTKTGEEIRSLRADSGPVVKVQFSSDGRTLASVVGLDFQKVEVRTWDVGMGKQLSRHVSADLLALSPDLRWSFYNLGVLTDLAAGKTRKLLREDQPWIKTAVFSPDSRWLAFRSGQGDCCVWDLKGGRLRHRWLLGRGNAGGLCFSADSRRLLISDPGMRLIDVWSGKDLLGRPAHLDGIRDLVFLRDGRTLLSRSLTAREVRLWRWADGKALPLSDNGSVPGVMQFALLADDTILATLDGRGWLRTWRTTSGRPLKAVRVRSWVYDSGWGKREEHIFSRDGRWLAVCEDGHKITVWDVSACRRARDIQIPDDYAARLIRLTPDGRYLVASMWEGTWNVAWRVSDGKIVHSAPNVGNGVAFFPDSRLTAWPVGAKIYLADLIARRWVGSLARPQSKVKENRRPDGENEDFWFLRGSFVAVRGDKRLQLWSPSWREPLRSFRSRWGDPEVLAATPATMIMSDGGERGVEGERLYDAFTGRLLVKCEPDDKNRVACLSADERLLFVGRWEDEFIGANEHPKSFLDVHERITGGKIASLRHAGHRAPISSVALSPDGRYVATGSFDSTILVSDLRALIGRNQPRHARLTKASLEQWWRYLAEEDSAAAWLAMGGLVESPEAIGFLAERLQPVLDKEVRMVRQWLTDLDDDEFATRQKARKQLGKLGAEWLPEFYRALAAKPSLEVASSIEKLLRAPASREFSPDMIRRLRAVAVLEWQGGPEAKKTLRSLARGPADLELTLQAGRALQRLGATSESKSKTDR